MQAAEAIISRIERAAKTEKNGGRLELEWRLLLTVPHVYINIYIYIHICVYIVYSRVTRCVVGNGVDTRRMEWRRRKVVVEESAINFAEFTI